MIEQEFLSLMDVIDTLLSEQGCPWDRKQTLLSMRKSLLEEAYEVIEAIDDGEKSALVDELGDLLFNGLFLCRLAEKEEKGTLSEALQCIKEKLIRRHPHIFKTCNDLTSDEVLKQWEEIKKEEYPERQNLFDGISKALPSLLRAQKVLKTLASKNHPLKMEISEEKVSEEVIGKQFLELTAKAMHSGIDAEQALRGALHSLEKRALQSQALHSEEGSLPG